MACGPFAVMYACCLKHTDATQHGNLRIPVLKRSGGSENKCNAADVCSDFFDLLLQSSRETRGNGSPRFLLQTSRQQAKYCLQHIQHWANATRMANFLFLGEHTK